MSTSTGQSSLVYAGIAPHPPIMVPEVGGDAIPKVQGSIDAMGKLTRRIIGSGAETILLVSPHAPLEIESFVAYSGPYLTANFENFGAAHVDLEIPVDENLLDQIISCASQANYSVKRLPTSAADHGSAVPLYFLLENGWCGRVVVLGYSFLSNEDHLRFGEAIRKAIDLAGRPVAFLASGDLSHRLKPAAPAGYQPAAHLFDEEVVSAIKANEPQRIVHIDHDLRKLAGECGYRSMLTAIGATRSLPASCEVLSYEAPFGVGYMVAQLVNDNPAEPGTQRLLRDQVDSDDVARQIISLAREAVETYVRGGKITPPASPSGLLAEPAPCFVSIKTSDRELRGCIGTIEPTRNTLAEEIYANAISAATHDPRFPPVTDTELPDLSYSVDVLLPREPATLEDLDPRIYGIIVEDQEGSRRGLLLPDIPGVDSTEQQVQIAARKAGIHRRGPIRISRFRVQRFRDGQDLEEQESK
jgi:AmmeMemoRadiSam system protein A